jgi:hypothetical protein
LLLVIGMLGWRFGLVGGRQMKLMQRAGTANADAREVLWEVLWETATWVLLGLVTMLGFGRRMRLVAMLGMAMQKRMLARDKKPDTNESW